MTVHCAAGSGSVAPCRLLIHSAAPGPWNMAVDEVLLDEAIHSGRPCWRFYRWEPPTLSLGYFQRYERRQEHPPSLACAVVRRLSGGGAIVHHQELTYSVVLPVGHPLARKRLALYHAVHATLVETLADCGVKAEIYSANSAGMPANEPFLCFQRRSPGDVLVGNVKIAGSAQRRSAGAVLQHGSVILRRSPFAPEIPGLNDIVTAELCFEDLIGQWLPRLARRLGFRWHEDSLGAAEQAEASRLARRKYAATWWTRFRQRRPPEPYWPGDRGRAERTC